MVDISYANYMRLCNMLLIPVESQKTSVQWAWVSDKDSEITRLMNLSEIRDRPEGESGSW